jgi:hypothetical protein
LTCYAMPSMPAPRSRGLLLVSFTASTLPCSRPASHLSTLSRSLPCRTDRSLLSHSSALSLQVSRGRQGDISHLRRIPPCLSSIVLVHGLAAPRRNGSIHLTTASIRLYRRTAMSNEWQGEEEGEGGRVQIVSFLPVVQRTYGRRMLGSCTAECVLRRQRRGGTRYSVSLEGWTSDPPSTYRTTTTTLSLPLLYSPIYEARSTRAIGLPASSKPLFDSLASPVLPPVHFAISQPGSLILHQTRNVHSRNPNELVRRRATGQEPDKSVRRGQYPPSVSLYVPPPPLLLHSPHSRLVSSLLFHSSFRRQSLVHSFTLSTPPTLV